MHLLYLKIINKHQVAYTIKLPLRILGEIKKFFYLMYKDVNIIQMFNLSKMELQILVL